MKLRNSSRHYARRAQREYNSPIVKIRSDNDTEFKNMKIEEWCDEEGIKHEFSATYTPQQMEWWKERTRHYARPKNFGRKQSIRRVMHPTECIPTDSSRKLHMSSSPGRNQIYHTFESLVANASSTRRKGSVSLKVDVMKVSFLVMHQTPKHIEYSIKPPG